MLEKEPLSWPQSSHYSKMPIISKAEDGYEIQFTLPGYEKEDLEILIEEGFLTVKTAQQDEKSSIAEFEKSYSLPEDVDTEKCNATMRAGILTISLEFKEPVKPKSKKIKIN
jgi:HSP20 family molecular chaperone IbpA